MSMPLQDAWTEPEGVGVPVVSKSSSVTSVSEPTIATLATKA